MTDEERHLTEREFLDAEQAIADVGDDEVSALRPAVVRDRPIIAPGEWWCLTHDCWGWACGVVGDHELELRESPSDLHESGSISLLEGMSEDNEPKAPLCPHGCYKRKPMRWVDDQWYCPKCGDEWAPELFEERT